MPRTEIAVSGMCPIGNGKRLQKQEFGAGEVVGGGGGWFAKLN